MAGRLTENVAYLALLSTIVGLDAPGRAGEVGIADAHPLAADDFLAKVAQANPRFQSLEAEVDSARAEVTAAGRWANPQVAFSREDVGAGSLRLPEQRLLFELPLELSGRRGLRVEAAEAGARAAGQSAERAKKNLLLDALVAYHRAAAARLKLAALQEQQASFARLLAAVRSRTAAGDTSGYDLDRLAIEADALVDLIADASREVMLSGCTLGLFAGASDACFQATDGLAMPALPQETQTRDLLSARADYLAAGSRADQAAKEAAAARRLRVPNISLSGGAKSQVIESETHWGYIAGLAVGLPILDYGQTDEARARARRRMAEAEQRTVEQQILVQARTSRDALVCAIEQAQRFESTQLPGLERLVARAEAAYREGERPVFELLDAYRTARGIRLRAVDLRLQARLAQLEWWRARGLGPGGTP